VRGARQIPRGVFVPFVFCRVGALVGEIEEKRGFPSESSVPASPARRSSRPMDDEGRAPISG
jgi:hypothetical protein